MFSWINKGIDYVKPVPRVNMPLKDLAVNTASGWVPYMVHMFFVGVIAKIILPFEAYPFAVILTALVLAIFKFKGSYPEITAKGTTAMDWLLAFAVGAVGIFLWIAPYHWFPTLMFAKIPLLGNENIYFSFTYGFDFPEDSFKKIMGGLVMVPTVLPKAIYSPELLNDCVVRIGSLFGGDWDPDVIKNVLLGFRVSGAVLTVPIFEELFIRSVIVRVIVDDNYKSVPIGYFSKISFFGALAIYVMAHPWWLVAIMWGGITFWFYYYKRNLLLCIFAHAVSNAILAWYVLHTGNFYLW